MDISPGGSSHIVKMMMKCRIVATRAHTVHHKSLIDTGRCAVHIVIGWGRSFGLVSFVAFDWPRPRLCPSPPWEVSYGAKLDMQTRPGGQSHGPGIGPLLFPFEPFRFFKTTLSFEKGTTTGIPVAS